MSFEIGGRRVYVSFAEMQDLRAQVAEAETRRLREQRRHHRAEVLQRRAEREQRRLQRLRAQAVNMVKTLRGLDDSDPDLAAELREVLADRAVL